jgi:hypothetical protein
VGILYIREYITTSVPGPSGDGFQCPQEPGQVDQVVGISGSPTQSAAFGPTTKMIRVECDSICSIVFGVNPTATTSNARLAANQTEYFGVVQGQKLSVISNV